MAVLNRQIDHAERGAEVTDFSNKGARDAYLAFMAQNSELFCNSEAPGGVEILTVDGDVERARLEARRARSEHGLDTSDLRAGLLAHDPYMTVIRDAVRFPDGSLGLYNRIVEASSVAALPLLDGCPVLISVFRHALRDWSLEFPRGATHSGESHEEAAVREVKEEVGAESVRLIPLGEFTPGASSLSTLDRLFVAEIDCIGRPDPTEGINEIRVTDVPTLENLIRTGVIIDGFTLSLFVRARLLGLL